VITWNIIRSARRTVRWTRAFSGYAPTGLPTRSVQVPISSARRTVAGRVLTGQGLPPPTAATAPPPLPWRIALGGQPRRRGLIALKGGLSPPPSAPAAPPPGWRIIVGGQPRRRGVVDLASGLAPPPAAPAAPPLGWRIAAGGQYRRRGAVDLQSGLAPVTLVTYGPHPGLSVRPILARWRPGCATVGRPASPGNPVPYTLRPSQMVRVVLAPRPGRAWLPRIQWPYTAPPFHPTIEPDAASLVPVTVPDPGRAEHDADLAYGLTL
jgi:hypothetical protein